MYSRLPPEPQRKEAQIDLFPDTQEGDSKPGLANYLDEFLSAIKVFGYLERPVFHELTRTMQTRKLIAGETLLLEEEKGFCLVVDGLVQIFVKSGREGRESCAGAESLHDEDEPLEEHQQGYQLLTEVKNGAPMSSLFSILSLFTNDIKLRHDGDDSTPESAPPTAGPRQSRFDSQQESSANGIATPASGTLSPVQDARSPLRLPHVPPLSLDPRLPEQQFNGLRQHEDEDSQKLHVKSAHPDIVARATQDTTIAIIPATAFRRLTRVYPKATAHIVQVILTRLQRVTLATGHAYLGLTSEVLRMEKLMNKYTTYDLPDFLRGAALERLKHKFLKVKQSIFIRDSTEDLLGTRTYRTRGGDERHCPA